MRSREILETGAALVSAALFLALLGGAVRWATAEPSSGADAATGPAGIIRVNGPIGPATSDYISDALETAVDTNASVAVLVMDTPGGLAESMRAIIRDILASPVPVVGFVFPPGSRAASAGTYILYACHVAAMAPGTNLGAATPVRIGGGPIPGQGQEREPEGDDAGPDTGGDMKAKIVNDSVAYIRSLAQLRDRNAEWAEKSVRQGASLPVNEALERDVIDLIAADIPGLLQKIDGMRVMVSNRQVVLQTSGIAMAEIEPSWSNKILSVITNPNIALILMLIGVYGLIFEFANPGSIGPGVVGLICLILGFYALNILPLNYTGLALLLFGLALMVTEAFVPSFGVLGIGGIAAFIIGAVILIDTDSPGFRLSWGVIAGTAAASGAVLILLLGYVWRAHRRPVLTGTGGLEGSEGEVIEWYGKEGHVRIHGERWKATGEGKIEPGDRVRVREVRGLKLVVEPFETKNKE